MICSVYRLWSFWRKKCRSCGLLVCFCYGWSWVKVSVNKSEILGGQCWTRVSHWVYVQLCGPHSHIRTFKTSPSTSKSPSTCWGKKNPTSTADSSRRARELHIIAKQDNPPLLFLSESLPWKNQDWEKNCEAPKRNLWHCTTPQEALARNGQHSLSDDKSYTKEGNTISSELN